MEPRPITLPPSTHIHDFHGTHSRRRSDGRSTADRYSAAASPMAMQVPNSIRQEVPPPLPPPRYVSDVHPDYDEGRSRGYGSSGGRRVEHREPSGVGLSFPKNWASSGASMDGRRLPERLDCGRRNDSITSLNSYRSLTDSDRRYDASGQQDEGYYSLSIRSQLTQQSVFALFAPS